MFSSLRSRLWLSYAFLIATALSVVALIFFIFLLRNPLLYRQTVERLKAVQQLVIEREGGVQNESLENYARQTSRTFEVRILLFDQSQQLLWDTYSEREPELSFPKKTFLNRKLTLARDVLGGAWLYSIERLPNGNYLVVAMPRPPLSVWNIFTDDFLPIFFASGLVALTLSLLVAFLFARWIADPLQRVVFAARVQPSDKIMPVEMQGPFEVQELMRAFNGMVARMQASQKSQRDFVANVSHELKTPLTSIQGFSQAILDGTANSAVEQKQAVQIIYDESARMHRMVLDLLDLAKLDAGTANITMSSVNMNALLNAVVEKFFPQSQKTSVNIKMKVVSDLPFILGDGDRLSQVFTNLVDNAFKFTPQGGSIRVYASVEKNELRVSVVDNGVGISAEAQAHIFDRFYQADPARKGGEKHGAGLGLAIAHEIVQAHGGKINVRSRLGEGTAFEIFLPLMKK